MYYSDTYFNFSSGDENDDYHSLSSLEGGEFILNKMISSEISSTYNTFPDFIHKFVEKIISGPENKIYRKIFGIHQRLAKLNDKLYDSALKTHNVRVNKRRREIIEELKKKKIKIDNENILTKAYLKLHECYSYLQETHRFTPELAVFIAELPGASILAYQHVFNNYNWYAQSGYYGNNFLVQDSFNLLKNYPDRWIGYKEKLSGNIFDANVVNKTIEGFLSKNVKRTKIISCDGGSDSYNFYDFNKYLARYDSMYQLMKQEWYIAENIINAGDCFVLKVYNTISDNSILTLLTEISTKFKETVIYRPLGGNLLNDEVYMLYINYEEPKNNLPQLKDDTKFCELYESIRGELKYVLIHQLLCLTYITNLILAGFKDNVNKTDIILAKK